MVRRFFKTLCPQSTYRSGAQPGSCNLCGMVDLLQRGANSKELSSEFLALQQETRSLREENAKLQSEVGEAKLSFEKTRQDLIGQQRESGAKGRSA